MPLTNQLTRAMP